MSKEETTQAAGKSFSPIVLIAEDEAPLRRLLWATLESERYQVMVARHGEEALALVQQHRPAVVVLDVNMPRLNGLEVARAIKVDPFLAGTAIVMLAGLTSRQTVQAARAIGVEHFLTKPFSPLELLGLIEAILTQRT